MSEAYAREWWGFVKSTTDQAKRKALLRIFAFAPTMLLTMPKHRLNDKQPQHKSARQMIRHRLSMWKGGKIAPLWKHTQDRSANRPRPTSQQDAQIPIKLERARKLTQEGAFSKAIRALRSSGIHAPSEEIRRILEQKHPPTTPDTDGSHPLPPPEDLPPIPKHTPFSPDEVLKAIKRFPRGSAAGASGLSPTHLLELANAPGADGKNGLLSALAAGLDILAKGHAPPCLAEWIAGAPLTALRKDDNGVRPIAVGETIRRLISSLLMARCTQQAKEILAPLQLGVAIPMGAETIVHAVRNLSERAASSSEHALLQVDLSNAFNRVSRAAFRKQTRLLLPALSPWVEYCYGPDCRPRLWVGTYQLRSVCGVQQGDPLGPLLFALALQPLLIKLQQLVREWDTALPGSGAGPESPSLLAFYLDDGVLIGRHTILQRVLHFFASREVKEHGLHLNMSKCTVWWPNLPENETTSDYPIPVRLLRNEGHNVLKVPIGSHRHMIQASTRRVQELRGLFDVVVALDDAHASFTLLRSCLSTCQVNYLLRTVPPTATRQAARKFDELLFRAMNELTGGTLPRTTFKELQLPMRNIKPDTPTFGLGLTSPYTTAPGAYLSSVARTYPLAQQIAPGVLDGTDLFHLHYAAQSYTLLTIAVPAGKVPSRQQFEKGPDAPSQRELSELLHEKAWDNIPPGNTRRQAFRAVLALPGAKDWAKAIPSPSRETHVDNLSFRTWLKFYNGLPIYNRTDRNCPRPGCKAKIDIHGDHVLVCSHAPFMGSASPTHRHDRQVRLLFDDLRRAARSPVLEPRQDDSQESRADIRAIGRGGGDDIIDIAIAHPFASEATANRTIRNPTTTLRSRRTEKLIRHKPLLAQQTGGEIVPIIYAISGGWEQRSYEYVRTIARETSPRTDCCPIAHMSTFFQRHAIRLLASSMHALTVELPNVVD